MSNRCCDCAFFVDNSFNGGMCSLHERVVGADSLCSMYVSPLDNVLAFNRFSHFFDLCNRFYFNTGICPRCGEYIGFDNDYAVKSFFSSVMVCEDCVIDELPVLYEDFSNWAVVCACRAVCDKDIKLF